MLERSSLSVLLLLLPSGLLAQSTMDGTWLLATDVFGNPLHQRLTLAQKGESLAGKAGSDRLRLNRDWAVSDERSSRAPWTTTSR